MKSIINHLTISLLLILGFSSGKASGQEKAQWITAFENQNATNSWMCFRKEFTVDEVPETVTAKIAADSKYWLWINGRMAVFEGAVKRGPNRTDTYYDTVDFSEFLRKGENNISVLVWYFGKEGFSYNPSSKGALFIDAEGNNGFTLITDASWKGTMHPAYYTVGAPMPNFRLPESSIGFNANADFNGKWYADKYTIKGKKPWRPVKELGEEGSAPWGKLHDRLIPQWKNYGFADYVETVLKTGKVADTLVCRLPYNAQVTPYLKVKAAKGDKIVMLTDHFRGGGQINLRAEYICKEGEQEYESLGWLNGHNMYYIFPKTVKIIDVKYRETSYDTEFAGSFESSDEFCNKMWEKARRTLLVTMRDTYMDCPDRERAQWWGDEVNESGEAFYALCTKSHALMKKGMYELIGWQRPDGTIFSPVPAANYNQELPGQMLASVGFYGFWNYYLHTGDIQPIKDLYPGVKRYLNVWKFREDGTIAFRTGDWTWGDWGTNIDKEALFNIWYYIALKGAANMANAIGLPQDAGEYMMKMNVLKDAFNARFWKDGKYRTPEYTEDTDDRVHALAVVSGIAEKDKYDEIFEVLKTQEYASPYMEKYVMEALFIMGQEEYGIERMKKRFREAVEDRECTTLYEGWGVGVKGYGGGTRNHAWSGGALTILSQYLCGISPVTPGYEKIAIRPQPANIPWAKAEVESVKGKILSSYKNSDKAFELETIIPEGTVAIVSIPKEKGKSITCNGTEILKNRKYVPNAIAGSCTADEEYVNFEVKPGKYIFKASK